MNKGPPLQRWFGFAAFLPYYGGPVQLSEVTVHGLEDWDSIPDSGANSPDFYSIGLRGCFVGS
jgi:hypothetical protein